MKRPLLFRLMGRAGELIPESGLRFLLRLSSRFLVRFNPGQRRILERILRFQGRQPAKAEIDRLIVETADLYAETLLNLCRLCRPGSFMRPPRPVALELLPAIDELRQGGRGVILAIAHFGDLFLAVSALARQDLPVTAIFVNGGHFSWIEVQKLRVVSLGGAAAASLRALAHNEIVMTYDDLPLFPEGRTAAFFGAPVFPPNGAARLALAAGAPILPIYSVFADGKNSVLCDDPIFPKDFSSQEEIEDRLLRSLEKFIARHPTHWMPFHDIWNVEMMRGRRKVLAKI